MYVNLDLYQGFFPVVVVQVMPYSLMLHFLCKVYSILQILFFSYIKLSLSFVCVFFVIQIVAVKIFKEIADNHPLKMLRQEVSVKLS